MNIEYENIRSAMKDSIYSRALKDIRYRILKEENPDTIFETCLEEICKVIQTEAGTMWVWDKETNDIIPLAYFGGADMKGIVLKPGEGIAGRVIKTGKHEIIDYVDNSLNTTKETDRRTGFNTSAILCVPIKYNLEPIGCIQLINPRLNISFEQKDVELVNSLISYLFESPETRDVILKVVDHCTPMFRQKELTNNIDAMARVFSYRHPEYIEMALKESDAYKLMSEEKQKQYEEHVKELWKIFHN